MIFNTKDVRIFDNVAVMQCIQTGASQNHPPSTASTCCDNDDDDDESKVTRRTTTVRSITAMHPVGALTPVGPAAGVV